ncbi:autotransporter-associated beta strand repeat-containing protein [Sphingomonas gei]|nr:autotransporter-associated beta strand repeat-containing protein [Sphingomonas gei]
MAQAVVNDGETRELQGNWTVIEDLTLSGSGTAGSGALRNLSGTNVVTGDITLAGDTWLRADTAPIGLPASTLVVAGGLDGGGFDLTTTGTGRIWIHSPLTNIASLTQIEGRLTLDDTNTFTGPVSINGGYLELLNGQALADTVALTVNTGAAVHIANSETIGSLSGGGSVFAAEDPFAVGAPVTLTVGGNNASTTFSGSLQDGGANVALFAKIGTGTQTLTGANSYSGITTISGGTLQIGNGGTTGTLGTGNVINNAALRFNRSNAYVVANRIQGTGTVTIGGTGPVRLSNLNTYTGATTILSGATLTIANSLALGSNASGTTIQNGGTLELQASISVAEDLTLSGSGTAGSGALRNLSEQNLVTGAVNLAGDTLLRADGDPNGPPLSEMRLTGAFNGGGFALSTTGTGRISLPGDISNLSSLTQDDGVLALLGTNTFTGPVTINGGYLQLANGQALADTVALTVNTDAVVQLGAPSETVGSLAGGGRIMAALGPATLVVGGNNVSTTFSGALENSGANVASLAKIGTGTLTLSGNNSYTGTTTISGGTLRVGNAGTTGALGTGNVINNAALVFNRSNALTIEGAISGGGTVQQIGIGTTILTGNNSFTGITTINSGTLQIGNGGTTGTLGSGNVVTNAVLAFNRSDVLTVANIITGGASGSLNQLGSGTTILTGANTYTGTTSVSAGILNIRNGGALGSSSGGTTVFTGGALELQGGITIAGETLILYGTGAGNGGALRNVSGNNAWGSAVSLGSNSRIVVEDSAALGVDELVLQSLLAGNGNALTVAGAGRLTLNGPVTGLSALTMDGTGTLSLAGGGYSGATIVNAGTLSLGANTLFTSDFAVNNGGTLSLAADNIVQSLSGAGVVSGNGFNLQLRIGGSFAGALGGVNALTLGGGTFAVTGAASLATSINVLAGAAFDISGVNGGDFTVSRIGGSGSVALGAKTLVLSGAGGNSVFAGTIAGSGGLNVTGGTQTLSGTNSYTGVTTITNGTLQLGNGGTSGSVAGAIALAGGTLAINRSDDIVLSGITGAGSFVQGGTGTTQLTGISALTGITVASGGLRLVGDPTTGAALTVNGGTLNLGALTGGTASFASLTGVGGGAIQLGATTLTVGGTGATAFDGVISGTGGFNKVGTGVLTLSGANTYTGLTEVREGTLRLGASEVLPDDGALAVLNGATLDLQGFIETVASFSIQGNLIGNGKLIAGAYRFYGGTVGQGLGAGAVYQISGATLLQGTSDAATVYVQGGTLALGATERLSDSAALDVQTGATLDLGAFDETVDTLALNGTLDGTGTLAASSYALDGAAVNANLGAGTLTQAGGTSLLSGSASAQTVAVSGGMLRLGAANRLADNAAVTVARGTMLDLGSFDDAVASLVLAGTLSGAGTLTAGTYTLDGARLGANLGTGALTQAGGVSELNGSAAAQAVTVAGGSLRLGAANRLADTAAVTVAGGTTLDLQGFDDTISSLSLNGALSGTGTLSATSYTLNGAAIDANLSGGTLTQAGGVSILRGTATGVTARVDGGTFQIGDGGTSGSFAGDVAVAANLVFNRSDAVSYAGALSGNGSVTQQGGVLTLSGDSSAFAGTTTVSGSGLTVAGTLGGAVAVNQGALSGTGSIGGAVTIADGAHLVGAQGGVLSMGSLVLNAGSIVDVLLSQPSSSALFDVGGALTLDGTLNISTGPAYGPGIYRLFDYAGTLTDNGLAIGTINGTAATGLSVQTAAAGQVNLVNLNSATLAFWDGGNTVLHDNNAVDGGAGSWSVGGRNWTTPNGALNGAMTPAPSFAVFQGAGGAVTIDNNTGQVAATGMQFASDGYTLSGGALALSGARSTIRVGDGTAAGAGYTATIASALTGSATLVKADLGTLALTGANTYTGGTVIEAGTLIGNAGSIQGNVANAGALMFDQAVGGSYAGSVTGAGTVTKAGAGALTLTGANATNWSITGGSLVTTSALFTGDVALSDGASLVFDQAGDGSYAGVINGSGQFLVQGRGAVLLTGDSSAFTGSAIVSNALSVNGKLGGMVDVLTGGRLQGMGAIGSTRIAGTIAPGNSIGTLSVAGDLSFLAGSVYAVEVNAAGQSDKIVVGGSATIASGTTVTVLAANGNYAANTSYTILTATGGLSGTFSNVASNLAFLTPTLIYNTTAVVLNLRRNTIDFATIAQTRNQRAVAPAVEALGLGNTVFDATVLLTAPEARAAFDQLAGSDYASMRGRLVEDSHFIRDAMLSRSELGGVEGLSVWGRAMGSSNTMDGNAEAQGYDRSIKGFLTGFDGSLGANWRVGVALGYDKIELHSGNATHNADSYSAGGYLLGSYGALRVQLGGGYSWHDIRSQRSVAFGSLAQMLGDQYDARTFQVFSEIGTRTDLGGFDLQPFVGVAHVTLFDGSIAEHGGSAALSGGVDSVKVTYGNAGVRTKLAFNLGETTLRLAGSAALRQTFGHPVPTVDLRFAGGAPFQVQSMPLDRTTGVVDAGIEFGLGKSTVLGISYTGAYGSRTTDHGARAAISMRF